MADGGQRSFKPGMLVMCENKLCSIQKIVSELGFNRYIVCAVDTGEIFNKLRYELDFAGMPFLDDKMEPDERTVNDIKEEIVEKPMKKPRFETINDEDLNKLAINRNSKHTRTQTAWGVAVFKGEFPKTMQIVCVKP